MEERVHEAERAELRSGGLGEAVSDKVNVASIALAPLESGGRAHGLITVARNGEPFTADDRELLRWLASEATLALENVELHFQQGDVAPKHVARVLQDSSRDADTPARYGGEEMALILPHTELEGSYVIAERVRTAIEGLRVPRLDQQGILRITASLGVAASSEGDEDALIADADKALYVAKRRGKNRTVRAKAQTANVVAAE